MNIITIMLGICVIGLLWYLHIIQCQMRNIREILEKRIQESTEELLTFEMVNKEFNRLGKAINDCLKAEETLRLKSMQEEKQFKELIANISHDLRTPLTAVKGYQQLLAKGPLTKKQQQQLMIAMQHTEELGELVEHFFEYAYLVNYAMEMHPETFNVVSTVTDCLLAYVNELEERGLSIQYEEPAPISIDADHEMVTRILQNLMRNCIKHSVGEIRIEIEELADTVKIAFTNPVKEKSALEVERIFDRFYTADRARQSSNGLGLSIVKLLVEQMGGTVEAALKEEQLTISVNLLQVQSKG